MKNFRPTQDQNVSKVISQDGEIYHLAKIAEPTTVEVDGKSIEISEEYLKELKIREDAPLLIEHDPGKVIGEVKDIWYDEESKSLWGWLKTSAKNALEYIEGLNLKKVSGAFMEDNTIAEVSAVKEGLIEQAVFCSKEDKIKELTETIEKLKLELDQVKDKELDRELDKLVKEQRVEPAKREEVKVLASKMTEQERQSFYELFTKKVVASTVEKQTIDLEGRII